jgi:hypothetical protein
VFVADDPQALQIALCLCFALFSATILQCECVSFADVFEGGFFLAAVLFFLLPSECVCVVCVLCVRGCMCVFLRVCYFFLFSFFFFFWH